MIITYYIKEFHRSFEKHCICVILSFVLIFFRLSCEHSSFFKPALLIG